MWCTVIEVEGKGQSFMKGGRKHAARLAHCVMGPGCTALDSLLCSGTREKPLNPQIPPGPRNPLGPSEALDIEKQNCLCAPK